MVRRHRHQVPGGVAQMIHERETAVLDRFEVFAASDETDTVTALRELCRKDPANGTCANYADLHLLINFTSVSARGTSAARTGERQVELLTRGWIMSDSEKMGVSSGQFAQADPASLAYS
jgi:hypothetical protein